MFRGLEYITLKLLPKRFFTYMIGRFSKSKTSRLFVPWFIRHFQIDLGEAERDVSDYRTWHDVFCRRLRPEARPIDAHGVISPVDGRVSEFGDILDGTLIQAKGSLYSLAALLGSAEDESSFIGGTYITLYLSPSNYHRIHMPYTGKCVAWTHIPGALYPVNAMGVRSIQGLFTKNERVITKVQTREFSYRIVKVGAAGVGSIRTSFIVERMNHRRRERGSVTTGELDLDLNRGEEVGWFEFGSTVILVFPPRFIQKFTVQRDQPIKMGQQIADVALVASIE